MEGSSQAFTHNNEDSMGSTQRKKPSSPGSQSRHAKRKLANSASKAKALVNKAEHVKKQAVKQAPPQRAPRKASSTHKNASIIGPGNTPEALRSASNENLRPALSGPTQAMAFWSPMAVLLRQQTFLASMALNVIQSQRLWVQAIGGAAQSGAKMGR
jgi:hypothetical protein